ncbi:DUF3624 domain-containing protein [Shewanella sp.]|uniref:DUF3624 domain-containing protein n=1 Tax=Shewanella sp. TaxID=50422 RepID=UPI003564629D
MACDNCSSSIFMQKIGRCGRCITMLSILCLIGWPGWYWLFVDKPYEVESIALLFFCVAWTALLALHLSVWLWRLLSGGE